MDENNGLVPATTGKLHLGKFLGAKETDIRDKNYCRHGGYELDEDARTVVCRRCGKQLDPFSVILDYARGERMWRHYEGEKAKALKSIAALQDEERKIKARTRSASRKDADNAVAEEKRRRAESNRSAIYRANQIMELARSIHRHLGGDDLPLLDAAKAEGKEA